MTLIELGEISSGSPEPPAAPPRRSDIRRIGATAVALLCVLAVTGSERPEPRSLPTLWSMDIDGAQFNLTSDAVYLLGEGGASNLRAYAAGDGAPRWSRSFDRQAGWFSTEIPGTLLVSTTSGILADGVTPALTETLALDAATGATRWRAAGDASLGTAESVLLVEWDSVQNGLRSLRMVRTADGAELWALAPDEAVVSWTVTGAEPERPDRFATVTRAGRMQVRRFADGVLVAEAAVPPLEAPRENTYAHLFSHGRDLFMVRVGGVDQEITAYDPQLRPRWERTGPAAFGVFGCGALLCAGTAEDEVEALDPATGAVRWHAAGFDFARPVGDGTLLVESHRTTRQSLVDERTGRTVADLGTGASVLDPESSVVLALRLTESPPSRYAVRQFDAGTGEVILRGAVPVSGDHGCQLAAGRLACSGGGALTVTDAG